MVKSFWSTFFIAKFSGTDYVSVCHAPDSMPQWPCDDRLAGTILVHHIGASNGMVVGPLDGPNMKAHLWRPAKNPHVCTLPKRAPLGWERLDMLFPFHFRHENAVSFPKAQNGNERSLAKVLMNK
jgi:hypothetical protein